MTLKNRLFRLPRGYSDIKYRLGGADFVEPFFTQLPKFKPFSEQDFLTVKAHLNTDTIAHYYGILTSEDPPRPINVLDGYGVDLVPQSDFVGYMTSFYGFSRLIDRPLKQMVLDHMQWWNDNYVYPSVTVDTKNLQEFALYAKNYPTIAKKLTLLCNGQGEEQLAIPIVHFKQKSGTKIIKSILPANYRDITQKDKDIYAMNLPKNVDIDGQTQFEFTVVGDDTAKQVIKIENPIAMARINDFLNNVGSPYFPLFLQADPTLWLIPPFTPPPLVITEGVDLNVFFEDNMQTRNQLTIQKTPLQVLKKMFFQVLM